MFPVIGQNDYFGFDFTETLNSSNIIPNQS